jgi:hypothetical protein
MHISDRSDSGRHAGHRITQGTRICVPTHIAHPAAAHSPYASVCVCADTHRTPSSSQHTRRVGSSTLAYGEWARAQGHCTPSRSQHTGIWRLCAPPHTPQKHTYPQYRSCSIAHARITPRTWRTPCGTCVHGHSDEYVSDDSISDDYVSIITAAHARRDRGARTHMRHFSSQHAVFSREGGNTSCCSVQYSRV